MIRCWKIMAAVSLAAGVLAMGCAPQRERYPAPIDYELLNRKMAFLREQGIIGPRPYDAVEWARIGGRVDAVRAAQTRPYDEAAWTRMEMLLREVETRKERQEAMRRSRSVAVLERVERAEEQRRVAQEQHDQTIRSQLRSNNILQFEPADG